MRRGIGPVSGWNSLRPWAVALNQLQSRHYPTEKDGIYQCLLAFPRWLDWLESLLLYNQQLPLLCRLAGHSHSQASLACYLPPWAFRTRGTCSESSFPGLCGLLESLIPSGTSYESTSWTPKILTLIQNDLFFWNEISRTWTANEHRLYYWPSC